jgi:hypothetical protein
MISEILAEANEPHFAVEVLCNPLSQCPNVGILMPIDDVECPITL